MNRYSNEFFANNWIYEGLVEYGPEGQILPSLAEDWTVEDTDDGGMKYLFKLRENVLFHDGAPWNCQVAKMNLDHVLAGALVEPEWHGVSAAFKFISFTNSIHSSQTNSFSLLISHCCHT